LSEGEKLKQHHKLFSPDPTTSIIIAPPNLLIQNIYRSLCSCECFAWVVWAAFGRPGRPLAAQTTHAKLPTKTKNDLQPKLQIVDESLTQ